MRDENAKELVSQFYQFCYHGEKEKIYSLLSKDFQKKYSLEQFLRNRRFRRLDVGILKEILSVSKRDDVVLVECRIKIGGTEIAHDYKCVEEEHQMKLLFEAFFVAR